MRRRSASEQRSSNKFRVDTQRFIQDAQAELMGVRRDAESAFLVKLRPAIERVVKDNGIQLLFNFDSGVLAWGDPCSRCDAGNPQTRRESNRGEVARRGWD